MIYECSMDKLKWEEKVKGSMLNVGILKAEAEVHNSDYVQQA